MTREDEEGYSHAQTQYCGEIVCPVCLTTVAGDEDVLDAHVDACLAGENRRMDEERERREMLRREEDREEWEDEGPIIGSVRGMFSEASYIPFLTFSSRYWLSHTQQERTGHRGRN